jgi:predicted SnoaL-like aldol condensation-catalyzing enzyme
MIMFLNDILPRLIESTHKYRKRRRSRYGDPRRSQFQRFGRAKLNWATGYPPPKSARFSLGAAGDGPAPFIEFVRGFAKAFPSLKFDFKRQIAEADLVLLHSHLVRQPGDPGMAVMDIFRLENGKIVEHWDVFQEVLEKSANSNTMF